MDLKQNSKKISLAILVLVLLAAIGFYLSLSKKPNQTAKQNPNPNVAKGPQPTFALKGETVESFPKELILDTKAQLEQSYKIDYTSQLQSTATFNSSQSMKALFDSYKAYLKTHDWKVTNEITSNPGSLGLYAVSVKANAEVSAVFIAKGKQTQVSVSYLKK